jgi:hypothetical protein
MLPLVLIPYSEEEELEKAEIISAEIPEEDDSLSEDSL